VLTRLDWATATPAAGWTVRDTVVHLHLSDRCGLATARGQDLTETGRALLAQAYRGRDLAGDWRRGRADLIDAVLGRPAEAGKLAWFGPPMSPASFLTSRLMETWAHGVDVRDAALAETRFTPRLRHVADLGVRTRGWSYAVRGLVVPDVPVRVELTTPEGPWRWGPAEAEQSVHGSALDFCLLVVQRRPRASLDLVADGPDAQRWLEVAQAFAGEPTEGRVG
jgi:uncharacterized protein (TIGR03084 family)